MELYSESIHHNESMKQTGKNDGRKDDALH